MEDKTLEIFEKSVKKQYEGSTIDKPSSLPKLMPNYTGSLRLDIDLGTPFPGGKICEIYGNPGSGKTTLALSILNEALKAGKKVAFQDQEKSLDQSLVKTFPALLTGLNVMRAKDGPDALNMVDAYLKHFPGSIVVIDSVDALESKESSEKDIGESEIGKLARLMSQACRKLKETCSTTGGTVIFINQVRYKIGGYGDPTTTSGGVGLSFYAAQRLHLLDCNKSQLIKDETDNVLGHTVRYYVVKNKVCPPFVNGQFNLMYGKGIDIAQELVDLAMLIGVVQVDGKFIIDATGAKRYPKVFRDMVRSDPNLYNEILNKIKIEYPDVWTQ